MGSECGCEDGSTKEADPMEQDEDPMEQDEAAAAFQAAEQAALAEQAAAEQSANAEHQYRRELISRGEGTIVDSSRPLTFEDVAKRSETAGLVPWPIRHGCEWLMCTGYDKEAIFR